MRVELVTECAHGQEEEHYLCDEPPYICLPDKSCECPGGSRSTVSGFSPEAVQAAALAAAWATDFGDADDDMNPYDSSEWKDIAKAALAAAWTTDYGTPT